MSKTTIKALSFLILSSVIAPTASYSMMKEPDPSDDAIKSAKFSSDEKHLITTDEDGTARIYAKNEAGDFVLATTLHHQPNTCSTELRENGKQIYVTNDDGTSTVWHQDESGHWVSTTEID